MRKNALCLLLLFMCVKINGNVEFSGSKVAEITPEQQWTLGQPGEGYIAKQPNAYMGLASNSKVSVGTLSTIWINENTIFLMDDEAQLTSDTWSISQHSNTLKFYVNRLAEGTNEELMISSQDGLSNVWLDIKYTSVVAERSGIDKVSIVYHVYANFRVKKVHGEDRIYGRFNLGKKAIFGGGRYTHFATYSNRTVSFGDRCQVKLDYWSSVYILDNLFVGFNSELRIGESSRIRISSCGHPACVIGDHSHVTLGVSAIMDINGAVILLNAANITLDRLSNMVLEPNSSLATALPKPLLFIGEQARLTVQRGTHCLLIDDVVIPPRTTWTLAPETIDERIKCFSSPTSIRRMLKRQILDTIERHTESMRR